MARSLRERAHDRISDLEQIDTPECLHDATVRGSPVELIARFRKRQDARSRADFAVGPPAVVASVIGRSDPRNRGLNCHASGSRRDRSRPSAVSENRQRRAIQIRRAAGGD